MNRLYDVYFGLPNFKSFGIIGKIFNRVSSKSLKLLFDKTIPKFYKKVTYKNELGVNTKPRKETYIISLTSFPERIEYVWITIESLLRQSFKADKIILWLAESQFPDKVLPENLMTLKDRGLNIEFCDDLRAHKKYYYSMKKFPEANIITVDDDTYYPSGIIKNLIILHRKFPDAICANRAHKIEFNKEKRVKKYRQWDINSKKELSPSFLLVPTGVGGVLYPPNSLDERVFRKEVFKEVCFFADDLWLKIHSLLNSTKVVTSKKYNKDLITVGNTQNKRLLDKNSFGGGNDEQLRNICKYYNIDLNKILHSS